MRDISGIFEKYYEWAIKEHTIVSGERCEERLIIERAYREISNIRLRSRIAEGSDRELR